MDSSVSGLAQIVPKECDNNIHFPANKKNTTTSRRTPSFSSSSSSSCSFGSLYFPDDSPLNPATPLRFSGVPFSWEHLPGIPKKNTIFKRKESILKPQQQQQQQQLPLPPTSTPPSSKKNHFQDFFATRGKKYSTENFKRDPFRDPFIAALVECSKDKDNDDDDQDRSSRDFFNGGKVTRSISDRFGFVNLYTSCKKTCAVSESIVYLPRSSRTTSYDLIHRRSR